MNEVTEKAADIAALEKRFDVVEGLLFEAIRLLTVKDELISLGNYKTTQHSYNNSLRHFCNNVKNGKITEIHSFANYS